MAYEIIDNAKVVKSGQLIIDLASSEGWSMALLFVVCTALAEFLKSQGCEDYSEWSDYPLN